MPLDPDKIKARRASLRLSQAVAAERAGMPQSHWSRIESGERPDPALSTAERIATALRVAISRILR